LVDPLVEEYEGQQIEVDDEPDFNGVYPHLDVPQINEDGEDGIGFGVFFWLFYYDDFKEIMEGLSTPQPQSEPTNADDISPVTGDPYVDDAERELVGKLTELQELRLRKLLKLTTKEGAFRFKDEDFRQGEVDDKTGCFMSELDRHLGDKPNYLYPGRYATYITGSTGDYFVLTQVASY
jgi:hypothetical protein